jgi:glycosyltransferase involved in cell wall biosynthesis
LKKIEMLDLSVIVCTHNPRRTYLDRVLTSLRLQTLPRERWELILVDNASSEPVAEFCDLSWHQGGRHVSERKLGLASARHCGIAAAAGRILIFVDDDNVLASDYLEQALRIANERQYLGAWGSGSIALEYEVVPASHLYHLLPWLAERHVERPIWSNARSCDEAAPFGAGLCVRRFIAEAYVSYCKLSRIPITGRKGTSLGAHEDFEICYLACEAGLGMGIFPELKILHLITKSRVTDEHFVRLVEEVTMSKLVLANKWNGVLPKSPFSFRSAASTVLNLFTRRGFDRRVHFAELRAVFGARRMLMKINSHGAARSEESSRIRELIASVTEEAKHQYDQCRG